MNPVKKEQYIEALVALIPLARTDTGQSRVAAQVLLSAHNGGAFQLSVADLGLLEETYYEAAITVIRGRRDTGTEPQQVIENGDACFRELWEKWDRFHVKNRAKPSCGTCFGTGRVPEFPDDENNYSEIPCQGCEGKGF